MNKIACSYYPTTVVFIDDNEQHLTQIVFELNVHLTHITFSQPQKALDYIKVHGEKKKHVHIDPSLPLIYIPECFNIPSVLAIDYDMPGTGMNGFTLSQEIKKVSAVLGIQQPKIILVTGQATEKTAIEGFHKGYIDRYISKNDRHYGRNLNENILELQKIFLTEQSAILFEQLASQPSFCLTHPKFIEVLTKICHEHHIAERHIVSQEGDFLLLKEDGSVLWFVVFIADDLKNKHKVAYRKFAKEIPGSPYSYALVAEPDLVPIQRDKICSFRHYLDDIWPPI